MGVPQILTIALMAISLLIQAYMHGKPRIGTYNVFGGLASAAITVLLLWWGGFFGG